MVTTIAFRPTWLAEKKGEVLGDMYVSAVQHGQVTEEPCKIRAGGFIEVRGVKWCEIPSG